MPLCAAPKAAAKLEIRLSAGSDTTAPSAFSINRRLVEQSDLRTGPGSWRWVSRLYHISRSQLAAASCANLCSVMASACR